ncbi:hypothetical protein SAMN05444959_102234 [Paracoccus seriniphilus]|uniref:Uncharacterized protein n=1 Tax=Paracoccus seriniphilus TaxID=184748 RepID=A0A239PNH4_9RHOB|nr:hypothetical protein SAMN05444959_102234 [Paracoccus seriniphilus]
MSMFSASRPCRRNSRRVAVTTEIFTDCRPANLGLAGQLRGMSGARLAAGLMPQQEG